MVARWGPACDAGLALIRGRYNTSAGAPGAFSQSGISAGAQSRYDSSRRRRGLLKAPNPPDILVPKIGYQPQAMNSMKLAPLDSYFDAVCTHP